MLTAVTRSGATPLFLMTSRYPLEFSLSEQAEPLMLCASITLMGVALDQYIFDCVKLAWLLISGKPFSKLTATNVTTSTAPNMMMYSVAVWPFFLRVCRSTMKNNLTNNIMLYMLRPAGR